MKRIDIRYIAIIGILLVLIIWLTKDSNNQRREFIEVFTKANGHYRHSEYQQAINSYEAILNEGFVSGSLYYNLADAYYRAGQTGKAVLNYRRALRLMPRDSDLNYNYNFIRRKLPVYAETQEGLLGKLVEKHIRFYSLDESGKILLSLLAVLAVLNITGLAAQWPKKRIRNIFLMFGIIFIVYLLGAVFTVQYEKNRAVILTGVAARFEPKSNATTHFEILEGEEVKLLKVDSLWSKIKRLDGKMGWVSSENVEEI